MGEIVALLVVIGFVRMVIEAIGMIFEIPKDLFEIVRYVVSNLRRKKQSGDTVE